MSREINRELVFAIKNDIINAEAIFGFPKAGFIELASRGEAENAVYHLRDHIEGAANLLNQMIIYKLEALEMSEELKASAGKLGSLLDSIIIDYDNLTWVEILAIIGERRDVIKEAINFAKNTILKELDEYFASEAETDLRCSPAEMPPVEYEAAAAAAPDHEEAEVSNDAVNVALVGDVAE